MANRKSMRRSKEASGCVFCKRSNEAELDFGGLLSTKNLQAHYFCLLLSESISQSGGDKQGIWGFLNKDIINEVQKSKKQQCHYCTEFGATLACSRTNCKRKFHLPCGVMNRTQHDYEKFISYCHAHRKACNVPPKLRNKMKEFKCLICLEGYSQKTNLENVVWAACCKKDVILHIACVKQLALSAGYFTKCPACNNNEEFISTVKKYGVFVPERDASWEIAGNFFDDLLVRHNRCDVEKCLCVKGRDYKHSSGNWKIILCDLCGSFGGHRACIHLQEQYICDTCNISTEPNTISASNANNNCSNENTTAENLIIEEIPSVTSIVTPIATPIVTSDESNPTVQQSISEVNPVDPDVISISSDSDDHFSETEPESLSTSAPFPNCNVSNSNSRKRKSTDEPLYSSLSRVAIKKTVYKQSRNRSYVHQVARKSTGGNNIYCNLWPRKSEDGLSDDFKSTLGTVSPKVEVTDIELKTENIECPPNLESSDMEPDNSKTICSIKSMLEKTNRLEILYTGTLILKCRQLAGTVAVDSHNELEIANLPVGVKSEKGVVHSHPKYPDVIVLDESDEEELPKIKISNIMTIDDDDEDISLDGKEKLSTTGIFENRIASATKDFFKRSRSPIKFKSFKRMKNIVKIDFTPMDSKENQRKVAPTNKVSLPRLELCAAVLLADLVDFVKKTFENLQFSDTFAWSDSTITLAWLKSSSNKWKTFVATRIAHVQSRISPSNWNHIRSKENPADCASRGIFPTELTDHPLWWSGPSWLRSPQEEWPKQLFLSRSHSEEMSDVVHEVKSSFIVVHNSTDNMFDHLLNKFSDLQKILRIIAYCRRFFYRLKSSPETQTGEPILREKSYALELLVKHVQMTSFSEDLIKLNKGQLSCKQLRPLSPFVDDRGLLRVGGRLNCSDVTYDVKYPLLLPRVHKLTDLIIFDCHLKNLHCGHRTTNFLLQQHFWILSARRAIRQCLRSCIRCFKVTPTSIVPTMGNLPPPRVTPGKAFLHTGVDFGGPFSITMGKIRGAKVLKAYLCLFVCLSTKAVHLELVSELSTEAFLAAFRRFISRRGRCVHMYSDCGTNFIGAATQIRKLLQQSAVTENIEWSFNPPSAPHFGGLWEAGIKSVKTHLTRVVGEQILTFEELYTVLVQIEALLNSRPLGALNSDPNDFSCLTPSHFLTFEPISVFPEEDYTEISMNRVNRWQLVQRLQ